MRRALLLLLVLPALPLVLTQSPAFACSCAMVSVQAYADQADVVLLGAVERADDHRAFLRVDRVLKGDVPAELEVVNGQCNGAALATDQKGAFFLVRDGDRLRADLCGGSGFVKPADLVAALGEGVVPGQVESPATESAVIDRDEPARSAVPLPVVLGAGALLLLAAASTYLVVRNRRS